MAIMKIVVDHKIPFILEPLQALADVIVAKSGDSIGPADVRDADVLIVRTRTRCNEALLAGSRVRLILTATIGFDHLDTTYLNKAGIEWHNCPGCNATSVAQYVRNSLVAWHEERGINLSTCTLGIVGVGHVGTAVLHATSSLVGRTLVNDPPLAASGMAAPSGLVWSSLAELQQQCDIITLHTPLTAAGPFATFHLVDRTFIDSLHRPVLLINAARGEVADTAAVEMALDTGRLLDAIIDTWEHEPDISRSLLQKAFIGTPHIAGYSADGKANATRMVLTQLCAFLHRPMNFDIVPPPLPHPLSPVADPLLRHLALYDPRADSRRLKAHPELFEQLRGNYPLRRERVVD